MFKYIFNLFLRKNKRSIIGYCQEKKLTKYKYFKFTKNTKNDLEAFIGDSYDYDFTNTGVVIWDERINHYTFFKSYCFPYNSYILRNDSEFKFISIEDFENSYIVL